MSLIQFSLNFLRNCKSSSVSRAWIKSICERWLKRRDKLNHYLFRNGIKTSIHYPIPIHLQPAFKKLGYNSPKLKKTEQQAKKIITLPVNQFMTEKLIEEGYR